MFYKKSATLWRFFYLKIIIFALPTIWRNNIKHLKMRSRITIEVDFENGNQPVIMVNYQPSDDVRDKLLGTFLEKFGAQSAWARVDYMGETEKDKRIYISPIAPEDLATQVSLMRSLALETHKPVSGGFVKMATGNPSVPRRNFMPEWTNEEILINDAIAKIEKLGANSLLTSAVHHLNEAMDRLADWVEGN